MSVVVTLFVWLLVPQVLGAWSGDAAMAIAMLVVFGALIAIDGLNPPDPTKQHPKWDVGRFRPAL